MLKKDYPSPVLSDAWLAQAFAEDLGEAGDKTTLATIDDELTAEGTFLAKEPLTVCGIKQIEQIFTFIDPDLVFAWRVQDADQVANQTVLGTVSGKASSLLKAERTGLNLLQRLSGIATLTFEYKSVLLGADVEILDTRKTLPLYRTLEKYAVRCGGGQNHRMGLYDEMMVKDNHISANQGDIFKTVSRAKKAYPDVFLVAEIAKMDQIEGAIKAGADRLLLDNMEVDQIRTCVDMIQGRCPVEISGGVTVDRLPELAQTQVDFISVGAITHGAKSVDISMKIELS